MLLFAAVVDEARRIALVFCVQNKFRLLVSVPDKQVQYPLIYCFIVVVIITIILTIIIIIVSKIAVLFSINHVIHAFCWGQVCTLGIRYVPLEVRYVPRGQVCTTRVRYVHT